MKYLLFIVLLVVVVMTAGCMNGNQNTPGTPTQATVNSSDPIVGIWQWTTNDGSKLYTFSFFSDGRYFFTDLSDSNTLSGTWSKVRENEYLIAYTNDKNHATITFPLKLQMKRDSVKDLHERLKLLGFTIPDEETQSKMFGTTTRNAVAEFQKKSGLESTGVEDEKTAELINSSITRPTIQKPKMIRFNMTL